MKIVADPYARMTPHGKRRQLLIDSDWTQLPDTNLTTEQRTLWAQYRQELRDMSFQEPITWPQRPGA